MSADEDSDTPDKEAKKPEGTVEGTINTSRLNCWLLWRVFMSLRVWFS